jgi:hypothetical protein
MAVIIPLKARSSADGAARSVEGAAGIAGPAKILLFTGVRYERHDEITPGPTPVAPADNRSGQARRARRRA